MVFSKHWQENCYAASDWARLIKATHLNHTFLSSLLKTQQLIDVALAIWILQHPLHRLPPNHFDIECNFSSDSSAIKLQRDRLFRAAFDETAQAGN